MYGNGSDFLLRLCHGHGSWKVWILGETETRYGIQAQGSYYGLEGAVLAVESHLVLWLVLVNGRATKHAALRKSSSALNRPMVYPKNCESETVTAQGCATVSSPVRGKTCPSRLASGRGMVDAEGGLDW